MIGVTANAACSIALRNSILKGVPKAFWADMYESARETAIGNVQTLVNRRSRALAVLQKMGVQPGQVFKHLGIQGEQDLTLDHLATLFGITTAIKEGDTTPEQAFSTEPTGSQAAADVPEELMAQANAAASKGTEAFRAFWKDASVESRKLLTGANAHLLRLAAEADKSGQA